MRRPSVKIVGWLNDMVTNLAHEMRVYLKNDPSNLEVKKWLAHVEAAKLISKQVVEKAKEEKAQWKEGKK
jgi:arsenate reductase-like glutaredoxin family protein